MELVLERPAKASLSRAVHNLHNQICIVAHYCPVILAGTRQTSSCKSDMYSIVKLRITVPGF